jgi:RNA polymerase sigma-70 factor (ECF subfamily)
MNVVVCDPARDLSWRPVSESTQTWERALAARLCAGDDSALAVAYDQYSPLVYGVAVHLVGSAGADDICQEVFSVLWAHPERFDATRGSLRTFLAVIARRRCTDVLRQEGRRRAREERIGTDGSSAVSPPSVEEAAEAMLAAEHVRRALDRLPIEQRAAIKLAYLDGLTYQAVATRLGIPEGTAKSRLRLGLRRLARELGALGIRTGAST